MNVPGHHNTWQSLVQYNLAILVCVSIIILKITSIARTSLCYFPAPDNPTEQFSGRTWREISDGSVLPTAEQNSYNLTQSFANTSFPPPHRFHLSQITASNDCSYKSTANREVSYLPPFRRDTVQTGV